MHKGEKWKWSRSVVSDSERPHGLQPTGLLHPWDFPGKSTGVGCHCLHEDKGIIETVYLRLGLEPTWLGLKPGQNPVWDSNPHGWDSNSAKTHNTWFQDSMKLKFLMSYCRKNSVRDKVIGGKWIYLERNRLHRQSVGYHRGWVWQPQKCGMISFYGLDIFIG